MKALRFATIFALLVLGAISNNVQPTEILTQRIPAHGLKMLGNVCCNNKSLIKNDNPHKPEPNQQLHPYDRYK